VYEAISGYTLTDCGYGRRCAAERSFALTLASTAMVLRLCLALASRVPASSGKICRHFGYCSPYCQRRFFDTMHAKQNAGKTRHIKEQELFSNWLPLPTATTILSARKA
jgi:hypothetical protein